MSTETFVERQARQFRAFMKWTKSEGGVEGPTLLKTLWAPHQQARIKWLRSQAKGTVLEVGCNWGYVLAACNGQAGVDINPANVELARLLAPEKTFQVADALSLPFGDKTFTTVMVPETLEHLDFPLGVSLAIKEACRVAIDRVLITMPDGRKDSEDACNFKHIFLLDEDTLAKIIRMFPRGATVHQHWFWGFCLIHAQLPKGEELPNG